MSAFSDNNAWWKKVLSSQDTTEFHTDSGCSYKWERADHACKVQDTWPIKWRRHRDLIAKGAALHRVTRSLFARTKVKCQLMSVSTYWAQCGCKVHVEIFNDRHVHSIIGAKLHRGWNTTSSVPIMPHANIMLGYPTHCEEGLVLIRGPRRNKISSLWASLSHQIVGWCPISCSGYAEMWRHHTWGSTSSKFIYWKNAALRWCVGHVPPFSKTSRDRRRQMSSWLLSRTAI